MKIMKQQIKQKMVNYITTTYKPLDIANFIDGQTLFNRKCHINSVQYALNNDAKILLTICVGNDEIFVHFINEKDNKYIDSTLGWYGTRLYDYYLIREVTKDEYRHIWDVLTSAKKMLIEQNSNWLQRFFRMISEDDV